MLLKISVPVADLRQKPEHLLSLNFSHNPLRESQLTYGEPLKLIHDHDEWLFVEAIEQVRFTHDKGWHYYPGWVHKSEVSLCSEIRENKKIIFSKEQLIEDAKEYFLDAPYLWGGKALFSTNPIASVDCSGLIYMLYRKQNCIIPRDAHDQYLKSQLIAKEELEPGDLLFWAPFNKQKRITHVVLYKNPDQFIEAPFTGKNVRVQSLPKEFWKMNPVYFEERPFPYLVIPARMDFNLAATVDI